MTKELYNTYIDYVKSAKRKDVSLAKEVLFGSDKKEERAKIEELVNTAKIPITRNTTFLIIESNAFALFAISQTSRSKIAEIYGMSSLGWSSVLKKNKRFHMVTFDQQDFQVDVAISDSEKILGEILKSIFGVLREGGDAIVRLNTLENPHGLVEAFASLFKKSMLIKPMNADPLENEVYLVGREFHKNGIENKMDKTFEKNINVDDKLREASNRIFDEKFGAISVLVEKLKE